MIETVKPSSKKKLPLVISYFLPLIALIPLMPSTKIASEFEDLSCWSPNYSIHDEPGETGLDEGDEGHEGVEMKKFF